MQLCEELFRSSVGHWSVIFSVSVMERVGLPGVTAVIQLSGLSDFFMVSVWVLLSSGPNVEDFMQV